MIVVFRTRKLEREYVESREAIRAYGKETARRYIERINIIKKAADIEQLERLPGLKCHPLIGNKKGKWSMTLVGRMRLIFALSGEQLEIVTIEEVSKHYDQ